MAGYYHTVRDALIAGGCTFVRMGKGDHEIWYSPITNRNVILDRGVTIKHTANGAFKDAGLNKLPQRLLLQASTGPAMAARKAVACSAVHPN